MWLTESEVLEVENPHWVSTSTEEEKGKESSRKGKEKENESVQNSGLNSEALSTASRTVFQLLENERREKEKGAMVDMWDMCRINGAVDYDGDGVMGWVYECVFSPVFNLVSVQVSLFSLISLRSARPSDFSYKQDSQHSSTVVVSKMWPDKDVSVGADIAEGDNLLHNLKRVLSGAKACKLFLQFFNARLIILFLLFLASWKSPLHTLRAFFFHLRDPKRLESLHHGFLEVLRVSPEVGIAGGRGGAVDISSGAISSVDEERMDMDEEMGLNGLDERMKEMKDNFRFSVSTHLFGWDELLRLRMRLSLADFAWVRCTSSFLLFPFLRDRASVRF